MSSITPSPSEPITVPTLFQHCELFLEKHLSPEFMDPLLDVFMALRSLSLKKKIINTVGETYGVEVSGEKLHRIKLNNGQKFHSSAKDVFTKAISKVYGFEANRAYFPMQLEVCDRFQLSETIEYASQQAAIGTLKIIIPVKITQEELLQVTALFRTNAKAKKLCLNGSKLSPARSLALVENLRSCKFLEKLELANSGVTSAVIQECSALYQDAQPPPLRSLDVSSNELGDESGVELAKIISLPSCTLDSLNISNNRMTALGINAILSAVLNKGQFRKLVLSGNGINDESKALLAQLVDEKAQIEKLGLGSLGLDHTDILTYLCPGLKKNSALRSLDLSGNKIGPQGASSLFKALEEQEGIQVLNLNSCEIGDDGVIDLCALLGKNQTLRKISLMNNKLGKQGIAALVVRLMDHAYPLDLNLKFNSLGNEELAALQKLQACNPLIIITV